MNKKYKTASIRRECVVRNVIIIGTVFMKTFGHCCVNGWVPAICGGSKLMCDWLNVDNIKYDLNGRPIDIDQW